MKFSLLTLFPEMFDGLLGSSILHRAQSQGHIEVERIQIRDFSQDRHRSVDDYSFGGGPGMVMKADVLERALRHVVSGSAQEQRGVNGACAVGVAPHVVYLSPQGRQFSQEDAGRLSQVAHLVLVCGHYEGVDERFIDRYVDEELSLGDFVLTGGEIPAMAVVDAVARLLPGVLGDEQSFLSDSFYAALLDHPHYTRPARWMAEESALTPSDESAERVGEIDEKGRVEVKPPAVLLSGNHLAVAEWRRRQALLRTLIRRPDLLDQGALSRVEKRVMGRLQQALAQDLDEMVGEDPPSKSGKRV
ncbi:MAG: tRNA (guanosine(37)-N1)-methyltransferase TrmD [Magnetococcales bacterium]|nr:tRNA (guanosine(37)-N1)-methyltransferase TrmD [Magnetococcales bacterium]